MRKVDLRLIPALAFLYSIALIDRGNLPNARLAGADKELGISIGNRYSLLTMMFFVTYVIFDYPANLAIKKIGPALWLGSIGILWGIVTICMGFVQTWGELLICRIIFGAFEAGLFPGAIYLLSCWYTRWEIHIRFSAFYVVGSVSNGYSSLLAYAIQQMNGVGGYEGWRWIFIIEGLVSAIIGAVALAVLVDFPDRSTKPGLFTRRPFLTEREKEIVLARISRDRGDAIPEPLTLKGVLFHMRDWKIWEMGLLILLNNATVYSFSYFLPLILKGGFGFSLIKSYALLLPPYVAGGVWMMITAWFCDRYRIRGPIIVFNAAISVMGISLMAWLKSPGPRYVGAFLGVAMIQANIPAIFSYQQNNIVGQMKRSLTTAIMVMGGGCGGIIAGNVFRQRDAPSYTPGLIVAIAGQVVTVVLVTKNFFIFARRNRQAQLGARLIEGVEGFRYTY